jgi:hypothetical protein
VVSRSSVVSDHAVRPHLSQVLVVRKTGGGGGGSAMPVAVCGTVRETARHTQLTTVPHSTDQNAPPDLCADKHSPLCWVAPGCRGRAPRRA